MVLLKVEINILESMAGIKESTFKILDIRYDVLEIISCANPWRHGGCF